MFESTRSFLDLKIFLDTPQFYSMPRPAISRCPLAQNRQMCPSSWMSFVIAPILKVEVRSLVQHSLHAHVLAALVVLLELQLYPVPIV